MKNRIVSRLAILVCVFCLFSVLAVCHAEQGGYVLMNIPYAAFYEAEASNASAIDAVTSSTLMKPRTIGLAGGSYHVDAAGSDITGVIFPVYVEDLSVLSTLGGQEITDESQVDITVTNKGEETTTTFTGSDALFEAPSFSWYLLTETPAAYKTLNANGTFGAFQADTTVLDGTASIIYDRHADVVIKVAGADEVLADRNVSAAVLMLDDGTRVGLRHIDNLWRKTQIGFALDSDICAALLGKTIDSVEYITLDGVYAVRVDLAIPDDVCLLQGIPAQTAESMKRDIDTALAFFKRVCVNIMTENSAKIPPDPRVISIFRNEVFPLYAENPRVDIIMDNSAWGLSAPVSDGEVCAM